jgi:hypothetical protein
MKGAEQFAMRAVFQEIFQKSIPDKAVISLGQCSTNLYGVTTFLQHIP